MLTHFLIAMIIIIFAAKITGFIFRYFQQPAVMGEVVAGLALGPSLLGAFFPETSKFLLPEQMLPLLNIVAQIGVIIFMFLVGIELDKSLLKKKGSVSIAISIGSILAPFLLGAGFANLAYEKFAPPGVPLFVFSLFMGVALSITAFPVLARIIAELKISRSPMAALTLVCAAANDVTAWCLLALLIGVAKAQALQAAVTFGATIGFAALAFFVGKPLMKRLTAEVESQGFVSSTLVFVTLIMLASALTTEVIGIHALFGAFLFGLLIPHDSRLAHELIQKFEYFVLTLLLPVFFAYTGLRTQLGLLNQPEHWLWCMAIIAIAVVGKIGGTSVAAVLSGVNRRDALAAGVLMNTRGLIELVILNVGLDLGILTPLMFTMMVIMAVVTTLMTTPLFKLVTRSRSWTVATHVDS